MMCKHVVRR